MRITTGFFMAWGNFCIIPCPVKKWDEKARKHMLIMLPVIGLGLGALWCGLLYLLHYLNVPIALKAALMTAYPFVITGGIHLDGFMDCSDAILSRRPLEERQRILKDSHVGAFSVISLVLMMMLFFGAMWSIMERLDLDKGWVLILIMMLMRVDIAGDVLKQRPMSKSQYKEVPAEGGNRGFLISLAIMSMLVVFIVITIQLLDVDILDAHETLNALVPIAAPIAGTLAATVAGWYARKQLGGMSGDIAGYSLVWGELIAVVAFAMVQ